LTTEHLTTVFGQALLHLDEGKVFLDDPAHIPVPGRHAHRERTIHTEATPGDMHGQSD
jgi:hypothetical protein